MKPKELADRIARGEKWAVLPPLPESFPAGYIAKTEYFYTADQMQAYGQVCRAAALEKANKREPLSEQKLFAIWHALPDDGGAFPDFVDAARAIEQAHHITVK